MSEIFSSKIREEELIDCVRVLEFRYTQDDLTGVRRTTQVDPLGYAHGLLAYLVTRADGETHEAATRAMLAEIDAILYPSGSTGRES